MTALVFAHSIQSSRQHPAVKLAIGLILYFCVSVLDHTGSTQNRCAFLEEFRSQTVGIAIAVALTHGTRIYRARQSYAITPFE